jgi:hypothetical protein
LGRGIGRKLGREKGGKVKEKERRIKEKCKIKKYRKIFLQANIVKFSCKHRKAKTMRMHAWKRKTYCIISVFFFFSC